MKRKLQIALIAFLAITFSVPIARAQNPGGITPAAWYTAGSSVYSDAGTTTAADNAAVQQWNDHTGSFPLLQATTGYRPVFSNATTLANFNPTVTFDGSNDWMQFTAGTLTNIIDRADGTLYAAGYVNQQKGSGFAGFHASMDFPGLHMYTNYKLLFFTSGGPGYQGQSEDVMEAGTFFSAGSGWLNAAGGTASYAAATVSLNGTRKEYTASNIYNANTNNAYRDFRIGRDSNYGSFSGQLNEVMIFENRLTSDQMDQVETYLAVKYGTTYAKGARDYKNAAGATVWGATAHAGFHNNIAGIARDNNGALYQKQSWSTNPGQQVLIGAETLANTNATNSGTLTDGQYLIWGDNGLAKVPTAATSAFPDVSHHFQAIWKVQNTGSVGTVRIAWPKGLRNLSLIQSGDATIDAGDVITSMTAEVTVNGVVYNYADITLSDGQYFTFAAKVPAPGGVTAGLTQWYRADEGVTSVGGDGSNINTWTDFARGTVSGQISTAPVPVYRQGATNYFNFNPGVNFTAIQQMLGNINTQTLESTSFDIFTLTKEKMTGGTRFFNIGMNNTRFWGDNWDHPGLNYNGTVGTRNSNGGGAGVTNPGNIAFSTTIPSIMYHTFTNTSIRKGLNGAALGTAWNISARGQMLGGHIFGSNAGPNPPRGDDWGFTGHIGEVIIYGGGNLTATERNRVDSYLALKYGITLPAGFNYLDSDGDIVWDATANSAYHNNVAGIVNDDASALNQKQSISVNAGQQVIIGTTGLANTNASNNTSLSNDGQYLIWGDNGQGKTLGVSHSITVSGNPLNLRLSAVWKVQNTESTGTVRVAWPSGTVNLHLIQSSDDVIEVTDKHTPMTGTITINNVSYNYADVTLTDASYFTFGGYLSGPGGVGQDLSLWYRADNGVETDANNKVSGWNNSTANDVKLTMNSATAYIPYNDQTTYTKTWNFNPTLSFDGTNNYLRNNTTNYLNTAGSVHYITVARLNPAASGYNSIFAINGNDDGFFLVGNGNTVTPMPTINNYVNVNATGPASSVRFGIYSSILPKTGTTPNQRGFYNGLEKIYTSAYPRTGTNYVIPALGAYIGADGTTGDNPNGEIAEVILYHEPTGGDMTNANLAKIHSYLAIKYGVTLDQTTPQDYVDSDENSIWTASVNPDYNNNIAGIGRDAQGSLYQKQSWSVNPGQQVLISTTGLSHTNTSNSGVIGNGQFLVWGDNGLAKAPTVAITGISDINYRFASVWKVQNTANTGTVRVSWPAGFANLKLIVSDDDVIDATDDIHNMDNTQLVNGVEYAYADVTLGDGKYFTMAAFVRAPGGVTNNLSYWYRADKFTTTEADGSDVDAWTDFTSGTTISQLGALPLPKFKNGEATYFNFNPGINYTAGTQSLGNLDVQTVTALNFDIYTLTKEGIASGGSNPRIFSSLVDNITTTGSIWHWDAIGLNVVGGNSIERVNVARNNRYMANPGNITYATTHPSIMYQTYTDLTVAKGLNGAPNGTTGNYASARGQMTGGHAIGSTQFLSNGSDNAGFIGNIGELIIYGNGNNTPAEKNKVESYLAIKYGLTLHNSNNYTTSQDLVVWDATANATHYNNVAGIGNDYLSALHQKQSRSQHTNSNGQVTMGVSSIVETNQANTASLADGQFLLWGDNGNTQAMAAGTGTYTPFEFAGSTDNGRRMNRVWKVQNTNNVSDEILIRFPKASVHTGNNPSFGANEACAAYVMIFADDAGFTTNVSIKAVTLTEDELDYDVQHTFPNGSSYFTYGKVIPFSQGAVYLPGQTEVSNEYITNCVIGEWRYFNQDGDSEQKLIGFSGLTTGELDALEVTITPQGTLYDENNRTTALMARITTVADNDANYTGQNKIRVYYDQDELDAATLANAAVSGWFKYKGDADDVLTDIFSDGLFDPAKAEALEPDDFGTEDGVRYVEFHNLDSFSSFVYISTTEQSPLPVTLTYFKASKEGDMAVLNWATANEQNNAGYEVERSNNARNWTSLGFVNGKGDNNNSNTPLDYSFTDVAPLSGINYYRLKQTDLDGSYEYSRYVTVQFNENIRELTLYPNPATQGKITLKVSEGTMQNCKIYSVSGIEIMSKNLTSDEVDISSLPAGMYILKVRLESGETINRSFIVK